MRRKVLQDFANTLCQQFDDLGSAYDVATFVRLGSGTYAMNLLTGTCSWEGAAIPELKACEAYRDWLTKQLVQHRVPPGLLSAALTIDLVVRDARVVSSQGHRFGSAVLDFQSRAELRTDETTYRGERRGSRSWGYTLDRAPAAGTD